MTDPLAEGTRPEPDEPNKATRTLLSVLRTLGLSQRALAKRTKGTASQATLSIFLRGGRIGNAKRKAILDAIIALAQEREAKDDIQKGEAARIRVLVDSVRQALGDDQSSARPEPPSRIWEDVMRLTNEPRYALLKAFDFLNVDHREIHAQCLLNGANYHWLVYETPELKTHWSTYIDNLRIDLGKSGHAADIDTVLRQVDCHVLPERAQRPGDLIPYRITIFGKAVCLYSVEREPNDYSLGGQPAALTRGEVLDDLRLALRTLHDKCPALDTWLAAKGRHKKGRTPSSRRADQEEIDTNRIMVLHDRLRAAFLRAVVDRHKALYG